MNINSNPVSPVNSIRSSPSMNNRASPAMVMENSQYRRPASILSTSSVVSRRRAGGVLRDDDEPLPTNMTGKIFLSLHLMISIIFVITTLIVTVFEIISLALNKKIGSVPEIPEFVTFAIAAVTLIALSISLKAPVMLLFGGSKTFKEYCFKDNLYLKYSSYVNLAVGVICIGIHTYIYFQPAKISNLTPFLPAGAYLILIALLNLKLHRELVDGGMTEQTLMLPYVADRKDGEEAMMEEMSDISGSNNV